MRPRRHMDDAQLSTLFAMLARDEVGAAWDAFLENYAATLLQVARFVEPDQDDAANAFLFACERLREHDCARLRRFDAAEGTPFHRWLRGVARNLCIDHRRQRHGRLHLFESLTRRPLLEQLVFRQRHHARCNLDETCALLKPAFPGLTPALVSAADAHVSSLLTARQRWILATAAPRVESLDSAPASDDDESLPEPPDEAPDPEVLALLHERRHQLSAALATLSAEQRLLIQRRFVQGLTLAEVARLTGLRDAQHADRQLRASLATLKRLLGAVR